MSEPAYHLGEGLHLCPFCASSSVHAVETAGMHIVVACDMCGARGPKADDAPEAATLWNGWVKLASKLSSSIHPAP